MSIAGLRLAPARRSESAGPHNGGGMEISSPSVTPTVAAVTIRTKKATSTAQSESFGSIREAIAQRG